jgi:predicted DNA-binding protein (MmcQ/YjbR family)
MIDYATLRAYCGGKKGAQETFPFDQSTLVFKVMNKMFALMAHEPREGEPLTINLKCDPALAEILRSTYTAIRPGYHMDKRHWNTVTIDGSIPDDEIYRMIDDSYALVVAGLTRKERAALEASE